MIKVIILGTVNIVSITNTINVLWLYKILNFFQQLVQSLFILYLTQLALQTLYYFKNIHYWFSTTLFLKSSSIVLPK